MVSEQGNALKKMSFKKIFNAVFMAVACHEPLVCVVAEHVEAAVPHEMDDADLARFNKQLLRENKRLGDAATEAISKRAAVEDENEQLKKQLKDAVKANNKKDKMDRPSAFWKLGPWPSWIGGGSEDIPTESEECDTMSCCLYKCCESLFEAVSQMWNALIMLLSNPFQWFEKGLDYVGKTELKNISIMIGLISMGIIAEWVSFILLEAKTAWTGTKAFVFAICNRYTFRLMWTIATFLWRLLKNILPKEKKSNQGSENKDQTEMQELKEMILNMQKEQEKRTEEAVAKEEEKLSKLTKEIEGLKKAMRQPQQVPRRQNNPGMRPGLGQRGRVNAMDCECDQELQQLEMQEQGPSYSQLEEEAPQMLDMEDGYQDFLSEASSNPIIQGTTGLVTVMQIGAEGRKVAARPLRAPCGFSNKKNNMITKPSMMDTGSSVNLISQKVAFELGLQKKDSLQLKGPREITSFNGQSTRVLGYHKIKTQFRKEVQDLVFMVVPGDSDQPLIGMPGLTKLRVNINCRDRIIGVLPESTSSKNE